MLASVRNETSHLLCGLDEMPVGEVGVGRRRAMPSMPEQLANHRQVLARHDGLTGGCVACENRAAEGRPHRASGPPNREGIETALKAAALDWSEIDPSILGTLFKRGLDPDKRSQLGAHYTDRDKIMRIVKPVIVRPLLAEWETAKAEIAAIVERADAAGSRAAHTRLRRQADQALRTFLERLRTFTVFDPACG